MSSWLLWLAYIGTQCRATDPRDHVPTLTLMQALDGLGFEGSGGPIEGCSKGIRWSHVDTCDGAVQVPIVTVNVTSFTTGLQYLRDTEAWVVCMQEHKVARDDINDASAKARAAGWKAVWGPASHGKNGRTIGGVAVFVKEWIGIMEVKHGISTHHRHVSATVEIAGFPKLIVSSLYLTTGLGGTGSNLKLLEEVANLVRLEMRPGFIGADFQMDPDVLDGTNFCHMVAGQIVAPVNATCVTHKSGNVIDYFVCHGGIGLLADQVIVEQGQVVSTHRPVKMLLANRPAVLRVKKLRTPKPLPTRPVFGPTGLAEDYGVVHDLARLATDLCKTNDARAGQKHCFILNARRH